jgi:hypothetical protein
MFETNLLQSQSIEKVSDVYSKLRRKAPATKNDLKNYIKVFLGVNIPDRKICAEHSSPMDYLFHHQSSFIHHRSRDERRRTIDEKYVTKFKYGCNRLGEPGRRQDGNSSYRNFAGLYIQTQMPG